MLHLKAIQEEALLGLLGTVVLHLKAVEEEALLGLLDTVVLHLKAIQEEAVFLDCLALLCFILKQF